MIEKPDEVSDKYLNQFVAELGEDAIPIAIIIMCKLVFKYELDIHWVIAALLDGYNSAAMQYQIPDQGRKYDS